MGVFFNGRLYVTPAAMSMVDDSAMYNKNLSVGNVLAVIGRSEGGKPKAPLRFGSISEARAVLRSGNLLEAIEKAFDPSAQTGGPALVIALRVNPATQASSILKDGTAANVITLQSTDFGLYTNGIKYKIESGTTAGKKITTQIGDDYFVGDDIARNAFSIHYTGAQASASMTINNTTVTLAAPNGTTVATIDLNVYDTVQKLVDRINVVTDFAASVLDGNGEKPALNGLDGVSAVDVKTALYTAKADLQAVVDWFNGMGEGYITATREADASKVPANIGFTYLTGGSDGTVTNTDWSDCFTVLQTEDVQWVVPLSSDPSIHAMGDTHCAFMSNIGRKERRAICGTAAGTTDDAAITAAKALNSDRTSLCHIGFYDYNAAGQLTLYPPYILAALLGGMVSGVNPGTALTNKTIKVRGLERKLKNPTDTDKLINGGVLCIEETPKGFKVVKSISTWLVNKNYNRVEISCGTATDFAIRNVREAVEDMVGEKGNARNLSLILQRAESKLRELSRPEPMGPGVLVGDEKSPPYRGLTVSLEGDVARLEFEASPVIPMNYIPIVMHAVPFSGKASA